MSIVIRVKRGLSKIYLNTQLKRYEKVYKTDKCNLNYLFIPNKYSDKLLVVFSGFSDYGQPARYNYVRSFQNTNINRLYILDDFGYDKRGCYYLGKEGDLYVDAAVNKLIEEISDKKGISKENIITSGTSKGGYAALYFALKYNYGIALAGAPQTLLGDYLIKSKTFETLKFVGGEDQEKAKVNLNSILFDVVENKVNNATKVFMHVGKGDHHYEDHVIPFKNHLENNGVACELDIGNYENHGDVGKFFPPFALKKIGDE